MRTLNKTYLQVRLLNSRRSTFIPIWRFRSHLETETLRQTQNNVIVPMCIVMVRPLSSDAAQCIATLRTRTLQRFCARAYLLQYRSFPLIHAWDVKNLLIFCRLSSLIISVTIVNSLVYACHNINICPIVGEAQLPVFSRNTSFQRRRQFGRWESTSTWPSYKCQNIGARRPSIAS